ncbi:MAG: hypothetical protein ABIH38_00305 [Patescibacteria group bacterium]
MKYFVILCVCLILSAMTVPVVAEESDNISLMYEHKVEGDHALGVGYAWEPIYVYTFQADNYWEGYVGHVFSLSAGFELAAAMAVNGQWAPLSFEDLMPTLTLTGHNLEIDNYFNFFKEPELSLDNPANLNDLRWSWVPFAIKDVRFGPLLDGNLSLYNGEFNTLTAGVRLTYEREASWGKWAAWLYLSQGVNKVNRGQGMARFQVRLAI